MAHGEWDDTSGTIKALTDALRTYDWKQARLVCSELVADIDIASAPYPERPAKQILNMLRRKRRFELMELVADAMLQGGQNSAHVRRQYAQCLIDQGKFTAAHAVLDLIVSDPEASKGEKAEARGLSGRIYKQLYVNSHDPSSTRQQTNLRRAVKQYHDVYESAPQSYLWQGINSVALMARADRDQVDVPGFPAAEVTATEIREILQQMGDLYYWDHATALETAAALSDWRIAYDHLVYYLADPQVDAFEIGSLLRQLTEVWQMTTATEPGCTILPTLKAALLRAEGGCVDVRNGRVGAEADVVQSAQNSLQRESGKRLEKVFGTDRFQPLTWYKTGLQRCAAVARIEAVMGTRVGTGFLVRASDFFPNRSDRELLLLTNAHVISPTDSPYPGALPPEAALAIFEASGQTFAVGQLIWSSDPDHLDATFVSLESIGEGAELCPLKPPPAAFDRNKPQRVYLIGYPEGGGLSFSLQDSVWLDTDGTLLHYRTPTNPGSSGSPVFDEQFWTLIALHHAGDKDMPRLNGAEGRCEANEGIAIAAIQNATRTTAPKGTKGQSI